MTLRLVAGESLILAGDPAAVARAEFVGDDGVTAVVASGEGKLTLARVAVRGGGAERGGCVSLEADEVRVHDAEFAGCVAGDGGGAYLLGDFVEVADSRFRANRAGERGGGLLIETRSDLGRVVVRDCEFVENEAAAGGALSLQAPVVDTLVTGCRFLRNRATRQGGALSGYLGGLIEGNLFAENEGGPHGGVVEGNAAWPTAEIAHNVFRGNRAASVTEGGTSCCDPAGALQVVAYGSIHNNLFVDNRSEADPTFGSSGPGALAADGRARITNNTFVDNTSVSGPAHMLAPRGLLSGNIFAGGGGRSGVGATGRDDTRIEFCASWSVPEPTYTDDVVLGDGLIDADPVFTDAAARDFRLAPDSPCRDAADPAPEFLDPDGSRGDMGAFGGPGGGWIPLLEGGTP